MNGLQQRDGVRAAFAHLYPEMAGAGVRWGPGTGGLDWGPGLELLWERSRAPPLALLSPEGLLAAPRRALFISEVGRWAGFFDLPCGGRKVEELRAVEDPGQRGLR